jgi:hypothetical protein
MKGVHIMGFVHTEITLKNAKDIYRAEDGLIKDAEIRQSTWWIRYGRN